MSNAMESDILSAVGGAAMGGMAIGLARQNAARNRADRLAIADAAADAVTERTVRVLVESNDAAVAEANERAEINAREAERWRTYAETLTTQVAGLKRELAAANFAVENRGRILGESDAEIARLRNQIGQFQSALSQANQKVAQANAELAQRDHALRQSQADLKRATEANTKNENKVASLNSLIEYLREKRRSLESALTRQSANTFVLNKILDAVVQEIEHVSKPENFDSLDPDVLLKMVTEEWEEYEETGEMVFKPRIPRLAESKLDQAFGGSEQPDQDAETTSSPQTGPSIRP